MNETSGAVGAKKKTAQFTPGPWQTRHGSDVWTGGEHRASRPIAETVGSKRVSEAEECIANARLIAQAPAMYEALKRLLSSNGGYGGDRAACEASARAILATIDGSES